MYKNNIERIGNGNITVIDMCPAFIEGKLYDGGNFPIVIKKNEGRRGRAPLVVHGALVTVEINEEGFKNLDAYEGCSKQRMLRNMPTDLYHRTTMPVRKVYYKHIMDFVEGYFTTDNSTINAWVYTGNMEHEFVHKCCTKLRRKNGVLWKTYFNVFS